MANTYVAIATVTVGSGGAANIEFTSIPGTYTDLCILLSARSTAAYTSDDLYAQFNSSSANFSWRNIYSTGSDPVTSSAGTNNIIGALNGANSTTSVFGNATIYIPNYTSSNYKSFSFDGVVENNATRGDDFFYADLWSNTSAITAIKLYNSLNFAQYSTATLYGIKSS